MLFFQIVDKEQCKRLNEGATTKTKSYSALCCFREVPTDEILTKLKGLSEIKDLTVMQMEGNTSFDHDKPFSTVSNNAFQAVYGLCNSNQGAFIIPKVFSKAGTVNAYYDRDWFADTQLNWFETQFWLVGFSDNESVFNDYDGFGDSLVPISVSRLQSAIIMQELSESDINKRLETGKINTPFILSDKEYV